MVRNQLPAQVAKTNYLSVQGNSALSKDKAALLRDTGWLFPISPREEAGFVRLDAQQPAKRDVLTNLVIERGFYQSWVKRFSETSERKKKKKIEKITRVVQRRKSILFFSSTSRFARVIVSSAAYLGLLGERTFLINGQTVAEEKKRNIILRTKGDAIFFRDRHTVVTTFAATTFLNAVNKIVRYVDNCFSNFSECRGLHRREQPVEGNNHRVVCHGRTSLTMLQTYESPREPSTVAASAAPAAVQLGNKHRNENERCTRF